MKKNYRVVSVNERSDIVHGIAGLSLNALEANANETRCGLVYLGRDPQSYTVPGFKRLCKNCAKSMTLADLSNAGAL